MKKCTTNKLVIIPFRISQQVASNESGGKFTIQGYDMKTWDWETMRTTDQRWATISFFVRYLQVQKLSPLSDGFSVNPVG